MRKIFFSLLLFITLLFPFNVFGLVFPSINSKVVEIYDLTDEKVIYEVDSNKISSIASLTKIVTTITAIENIPNLNEEVTVTRDILNTVYWDASKAGLKVGDRLTYLDLLYASMLPSGADATNTIAITSSGSIDNFVIKMNELVTKLGLKNTHFVNVTGLDSEGHYSTGSDIRVILSYALKNELFRKIYTTREYTLSNGLVVYSTIITYNKSGSIDTSKILGSKTGYTGEALYCLSSLSNINNHEFIIIVLNGEHINNIYYNIYDTTNLINFLESNYKDQLLVEKGKIVKKINVKYSKIDSIDIKVSKDIYKYLPTDYDKEKIKVEYKGVEELSFKNKIGEKLGVITYYYDNNKISDEKVLLNEKLEISYEKIFKEYWYIFISGVLVLLLLIIFIIKKCRKKKRELVLR